MDAPLPFKDSGVRCSNLTMEPPFASAYFPTSISRSLAQSNSPLEFAASRSVSAMSEGPLSRPAAALLEGRQSFRIIGLPNALDFEAAYQIPYNVTRWTGGASPAATLRQSLSLPIGSTLIPTVYERHHMRALSGKEKKQIQRYCVYPKIALRALIVSFALCALIVPLEMIDDLVFHNDGFDPAGLNTGIALIAICVAVFCFCALRPKFGMRGKQWLDLQNRLAVRQTQSDRSAQVAGVLATQAVGRLLQKSDNKAAQAVGGAAQVAGAIGAVTARNVRHPRRFQRDVPSRVVLRGHSRIQQRYPRSRRLLLRYRIRGGIRRILETADHALSMEGEFVAASSAKEWTTILRPPGIPIPPSGTSPCRLIDSFYWSYIPRADDAVLLRGTRMGSVEKSG